MSDNEASLTLKIKQVGGEILDHLVVSLGEVFEAVKKVAEFMAQFVEAAKAQEEASNRLNQSMVQQGMYSTELREKYEAQAKALSEMTTYSDEQVTSATAILQGMLGQKEVSQQLLKATMDLAAAKKMDLASAADMVGKTISGETNMLARQGIQLDNVRDKTERTAEVVQKLNDHFGGQAEAMTQGLGALDQMSNAWKEFQALIGNSFGPLIAAAAQGMTNFFRSFKEGSPALTTVKIIIQALADTIIVVVAWFEALGKVAMNVIEGIAGTMMELVQGNWKDAWQNAKAIVTVSMDDIVSSYQSMVDRAKTIDGTMWDNKQAEAKKEEDLISASEDRKLAILKEKAQLTKEFFKTKHADEITEAALIEQTKSDNAAMIRLRELNDIINHSNDKLAVARAETEKERIMKQQAADLDISRQKGVYQVQAFLNSQKVQDTMTLLGTISTLQNSHSKELVAVGKAAAIAQAVVNTAQGVTLALATYPFPWSLIPAGLVAAAGAVQIGTIAGVEMAEGGLVTARPGGMPAIIGEGGSDEMVIPLDDPRARAAMGGMGGGGTVINFHGPVLGNEAQAMDFARAIDKALLKLRQSHQSVAFETDFL